MSPQVSSGAKCVLAAWTDEIWTCAEHLHVQHAAKLQNHNLILNSEVSWFGQRILL